MLKRKTRRSLKRLRDSAQRRVPNPANGRYRANRVGGASYQMDTDHFAGRHAGHALRECQWCVRDWLRTMNDEVRPGYTFTEREATPAEIEVVNGWEPWDVELDGPELEPLPRTLEEAWDDLPGEKLEQALDLRDRTFAPVPFVLHQNGKYTPVCPADNWKGKPQELQVRAEQGLRQHVQSRKHQERMQS